MDERTKAFWDERDDVVKSREQNQAEYKKRVLEFNNFVCDVLNALDIPYVRRDVGLRNK